MIILTPQNEYRTPEHPVPFMARTFPTPFFYSKAFSIVYHAAQSAKRKEYTKEAWVRDSMDIIRSLEWVGGKFIIENLSVFKGLKTPGVFIGNHMSTLETFILPALIQPFLDVTFIVKESLIRYPIFKHIMKSCDPIVVSRTDPRQDLKTVLSEGVERLKHNISVVVFPQRTRTLEFIHTQFNTIGIKLARYADVPVIPVGVKTDAWSNGRLLKDFGKINPSKTVHIAFGKPTAVHGSGRKEHEHIIEFIANKLKSWS